MSVSYKCGRCNYAYSNASGPRLNEWMMCRYCKKRVLVFWRRLWDEEDSRFSVLVDELIEINVFNFSLSFEIKYRAYVRPDILL